MTAIDAVALTPAAVIGGVFVDVGRALLVDDGAREFDDCVNDDDSDDDDHESDVNDDADDADAINGASMSARPTPPCAGSSS